ncbi:MAG TPA: hypothetical protein VGF84_22950 [Micromonosporaceae bacterium]|jgi:hypothetical protein
MTRLDDLLTYDDGARQGRGLGLGTRGALIPIAVVAISLAAWSFSHWLGVGTPFLLIFAVVAALAVVQQVIRVLDIRRIPPTLRDNPPVVETTQPAPDGIRIASRSWNQRLEYAQDDANHFARMIQPAFQEIIDERIRLAHGVTRSNDPDAYRQILGPELSRFLTEPLPRRMTPQMIATLVAQMEAL